MSRDYLAYRRLRPTHVCTSEVVNLRATALVTLTSVNTEYSTLHVRVICFLLFTSFEWQYYTNPAGRLAVDESPNSVIRVGRLVVTFHTIWGVDFWPEMSTVSILVRSHFSLGIGLPRSHWPETIQGLALWRPFAFSWRGVNVISVCCVTPSITLSKPKKNCLCG